MEDKKAKIMSALQRVRPIPSDFIAEVQEEKDEVCLDQWLGFSMEAWLIERPIDGHKIHSALHPYKGKWKDYDDYKDDLLLVGDAANSVSIESIASLTSCRSKSSSGLCSTGRHVSRGKKQQSKFRKAVVHRDGTCVALGTPQDECTPAHIIPLNRLELITRDLEYSPRNGVLLTKYLENQYDRHMWYFLPSGEVVVLYSKWPERTRIKQVRIDSGHANSPDIDLIKKHNEEAVIASKHHCPVCWKFVGEFNIDDHQRGSCDKLNVADDDESDVGY